MTATKKPKKDMKYLRIESNSVRIEIRRKGNEPYRESLLIKDYGTLDRTLAAARKIRNQKLVEMDENRMIVHAPTVKECFEKKFELIPMKIKTKDKHRTIYRDAIQQYADKSINEVTAADIQKSVNDYSKKHTKQQTGRLLTVWKQIYKSAIMQGIPVTDWTQAVTIPKCQPDKPLKNNEISYENFCTFCDALILYNRFTEEGRYKSTMVWYMLMIMAFCGLRPAEAFGLERNDFHINEGGSSYISIHQAVGSTEEETQKLTDTKTRKSRRIVPMDDEIIPIVKSLLKWTKRQYVFTNYDGSFIEINDMCDYIRLVSKKSGVHFTMYMLRHKFSTDLINSGVPIENIRDLMGHTNVSMTIGYAYSTKEDLEKAIKSRHMA